MSSPKYFNCLLIGDWGTGKTTAALTAPKPILFLDFDNKLHRMVNARVLLESGQVIQWPIDSPLSGVSLTRMATMETKPGQKVVLPNPKGYLKFCEYVEKLQASGCVVDGKKVETVVLDSYTGMDEHLRRLLQAANGTNTMSQPLYGCLLTNFEEVNSTLLKLPANVIFICHEKIEKDELTGKIEIRPLINGSMAGKIGKDFEEVYAMEKTFQGSVAKYEMLTVGNSMKSCRTSRTLPPRVEPNFEKLYASDKKA